MACVSLCCILGPSLRRKFYPRRPLQAASNWRRRLLAAGGGAKTFLAKEIVMGYPMKESHGTKNNAENGCAGNSVDWYF